MMQIKEVVFTKSSAHYKQCPKPQLPEYAFIGRSNVGKSSLINALTDKKGLAKTSSTPGKTRLINHFLVDNAWYLVDLPGLGYAKISKTQRAKFKKMIESYFLMRPNLLNTFMLVDSRHEAQKIDIELMNWFGAHQIPFSIIFTKSDKLSPEKVNNHVAAYRKRLSESWEELPPFYITSAIKKHGVGEILDFIEQTNDIFDFNKIR